MAVIYNSDLTKELVDVAKIQVSRDSTPNQIADKVVPVIDVNPKHSRVLNHATVNTATNSAGVTIYTTPTDRDYFLTQVFLYFIKDVTSTSTYSAIDVVIGGGRYTLLSLPQISLTVQQGGLSISFHRPMKIDRGTTIRLLNSTNVANITSTGGVAGYTVENVNA